MCANDYDEDTPWQIEYFQANSSAHATGSMEQKSPFKKKDKLTDSLDLDFLIKPEDEWGKLRKYGRCVGINISLLLLLS